MTSRILFLDDCPYRCCEFAIREPEAIIVHTAAECIAQLRDQPFWDEVHLDHDLEGISNDDSEKENCGMEVVRWVLLNRPDVRTYIVHSHSNARHAMHKALSDAGLYSVLAPFWFTV